MVNRLFITALMVAALALAPGPPAAAQTAVEYGGLASKNQGGSNLGKSLNHSFKSVQKIGSSQKGSSHKRKKGKG